MYFRSKFQVLHVEDNKGEQLIVFQVVTKEKLINFLNASYIPYKI